MLPFSPGARIFVCLNDVDFRKGIDGLAAVCRNQLTQDPMSGIVFLFRNRRGTSLRILMYDGQGFWLCTKRLSQGRFKWWPTKSPVIDVKDLQALLWNGNPELARFGADWKKILRQ